MKYIEGTSCFSGFGFGIDFQEVMEQGMAKFVDQILIHQCPPKLHFARMKTTGDPVRDTANGYGMQPDNPLTLRLYIETFTPDDGSSIMFDQTIDQMVDDYYKSYDPLKEPYVELRNALDGLVKKMDEKIANWNPPQIDDENDD
jgi:hypothetical protein